MKSAVSVARPVSVDAADLEGWSERWSPILSMANWCGRHMRRGRSFVPRMLGKLCGDRWRRIMVTRHGARLAIAPRALDVYGLIHGRGRTWEWHVFETCRKCLRPGDVFYDLGANVGYMSIEAAVVFQGAVHCVAFEPQPDLARHIVISAHLSGVSDSVQVFDVMIGDGKRDAKILLTSNSVHASAVARERRATELPRQMYSLDALVAEGAIPPPSVIKVDVEGGELAVFQGAESVIRQHAPDVVFESDVNSVRFGYGRDDLIALLNEYAEYEYFDIARDGTLTKISPQPLQTNVLARSKRRHA
jgi:FkbM family methyltransferase